MTILKLSAVIMIMSLFLMACNQDQQQYPIATGDPYAQIDPAFAENSPDDYWAKDNFDLQRVGHLLERSNNPEEFERYLNDDEFNNLDLNGDNYADYISVEEFGEGDNERGLSLFSRFGPDLIQQIATIFFRRDNFNQPGARILLAGNEQLYGDNNYYETNWADRGLGLVSNLFRDRDYYRSPYSYDNYPSYYNPYQIVETPVYRSRIESIYPQPAFVYTTNPTVINLNQVKIRSPHEGKWMDKVHAKLAKPTKDQVEFVKNDPGKVKFKKDKGARGGDFVGVDKPGRVDPPRSDRGDERGNPGRDERGAQRGNPNKPDPPYVKPAKLDKPEKGDKPKKGEGNPYMGGNPNKGGGNPNMGGGNPNKGGGNPNKGGGNPNKGGGGKGGGKKP